MSFNHHSIDESGHVDFNPYYYTDNYNNYTFSVSRKGETTFIRPTFHDPNLIELKVGVLLPFHQNNNNWTRIMTMSGVAAVRLAVAEINAKSLIPGAYITLVEKDSYPKMVEGQAAITQAVFSAISLIQEGVVGVIGDISSSWTSLSALMTSMLQIPQCSFSAIATSLSDKSQFGYFFRTAPTDLLYADAALSFIVNQGWPVIGILYADNDFGQQLSEGIILRARANSIDVKSYQSFYENGPMSDIQRSIDLLYSTGARIIVVAAEGPSQLAALTVAAHSGYINNETVWISLDFDRNSLYPSIKSFNDIIERRRNHSDVIPDVYTKVATTTKNNKSDLMSMIDPVEYAARITPNMTPIDYNNTFSGGVFTMDAMKELPGYAPFDEFLDKWSHLDPAIYPYGGQANISSNEGLAYSCMMVMANGFNHTIYNGTNSTDTLMKLATGQLGSYLTPSSFNNSFVGPEGPIIFDQNGDVVNGNFRILNFQNGTQVQIGSLIAGNLNITSAPIYHDGTTKIPPGVPDRVFLNPSCTSPVIAVLLAVISLGSFIALLSLMLVIFFRKRQVFKASSPLFCILELLGFLLCYVANFLFVSTRTKTSCIIMPITFHLGYSLVLGTLIAKIYHIYRIFNNVFITKTVVSDRQLIRVAGCFFVFNSVVLICWLAPSMISVVNIPVSHNIYYIDCTFGGGVAKPIAVTILGIAEIFQLILAMYLVIKIKRLGRTYPKFSEYKHIGLSVYNIFFCFVIGAILYKVPNTDYYTRYYLSASLIVWANTFSLLALFIPKLHVFFFPEKSTGDIGNNKGANSIGVDTSDDEIRTDESHHDLISLNYMITSKQVMDKEIRLNTISSKGRVKGAFTEVHEAELPIQITYKYFPFLAAWDMMQIILMPGISYFSYYSEKQKKGDVFDYSGASMVSCKPGKYLLKVHGTGFTNAYIQVENEKNLAQWNAWFNISATDEQERKRDEIKSDNEDDEEEKSKVDDDRTPRRRFSRLDSGLTARHLLLGERAGSEATFETLDSCFYEPVMSSTDYNAGEIHREDMENDGVNPGLCTSNNFLTPNNRSSFYSSFNRFLTDESPPDSENTTVVNPTPDNYSQ